MIDELFENVYNPDVLSCLANLSNDEMFTPPERSMGTVLMCRLRGSARVVPCASY